MGLKFSARIVRQLGAELIGSDAIAFYELIKNAFDAEASRVEVRYVSHVDEADYRFAIDYLDDVTQSPEDLGDLKSMVLQKFRLFNGAEAFQHRSAIEAADSLNEFRDALENCNYVEIEDNGCGMSLNDLDEIYLTIGTTNRKRQRQAQRTAPSSSGRRPILGDKGIGRLAVMRLGERLHLESTKTDESHWNELKIDWRVFDRDDALAPQEIQVVPIEGTIKEASVQSGTRIRICALNSTLTETALRRVVEREFSRFQDPFLDQHTASGAAFRVIVRLNGVAVKVPTFQRELFEHAQATFSGGLRFDLEGGKQRPILFGEVNYRARGRTKLFSFIETELLSLINEFNRKGRRKFERLFEASDLTRFTRLGPFSVQFYWYNRKSMKEALYQSGISKDFIAPILEAQKLWAGGLMLYRDGFRVPPYGQPDDDWLDLDESALASGGYKVNRRQIIGKVDISSQNNEGLIDQTNRQGLRDRGEKQLLILLLRVIVLNEFKTFLDAVDDEVEAVVPYSPEQIRESVNNAKARVEKSLSLMRSHYPAIVEDRLIFKPLEDGVKTVSKLVDSIEGIFKSYERAHDIQLHLAGLGLMVEIVAHELGMAASHALSTLNSTSLRGKDRMLDSLLNTLTDQMKTLQKRVALLDPLSAARRQTPETFDLIQLARDVLESFSAQLARHDISADFVVEGGRSAHGALKVKMVRGMVVQILFNLLHNSVYWLKMQSLVEADLQPRVRITVDVEQRELRVWDNGPGVAVERRVDVFQAFYTMKPPGEGKGMGLFISRELAHHHKANLDLSTLDQVRSGRLNTFVLSLGGIT